MEARPQSSDPLFGHAKQSNQTPMYIAGPWFHTNGPVPNRANTETGGECLATQAHDHQCCAMIEPLDGPRQGVRDVPEFLPSALHDPGGSGRLEHSPIEMGFQVYAVAGGEEFGPSGAMDRMPTRSSSISRTLAASWSPGRRSTGGMMEGDGGRWAA